MVSKKKLNISSSELNTIKPITDNQKEVFASYEKGQNLFLYGVAGTGYVEDGAGVGDKDEDTMLAQLADGEFVTRADGVLGAGIIAGANPNSMKDMREKGAQYFYEQQRRYKRVFDLLKEANGNSKQKEN